jgi:hypothetical protein
LLVDVLKRKKADERTHRIVIKGRKVMEHHMVSKGPKKVTNFQSLNKDNDENYMLYYDDSKGD